MTCHSTILSDKPSGLLRGISLRLVSCPPREQYKQDWQCRFTDRVPTRYEAARSHIEGSTKSCHADNTYSEEDMKKWQRAQNIKRAWLEDDEYLISAEGSRVQVVSITRHSSVDRPMVWLQSEFFKIPVTQSPNRDSPG